MRTGVILGITLILVLCVIQVHYREHNFYSYLSLRVPDKFPDWIRLKEDEEEEGAEAEVEDGRHGARPAAPAG